MMKSQDQSSTNRPAWIDKLCEGLAQAFEDENLPTDAHNLLADAMEGVVNLYPVKRDANEARTLLPIALGRAINSAEDEDNEHEDSEKPFDLLAQELAEPLVAFLDHSRVPESISGRITDALLELADIRRPSTSNGGLAKDALIDLAAHLSK